MVALEFNTYAQRTLPFAPRIRKNVAEMSRLINAALVDRSFCDTLLYNPVKALKDGFNGEAFELSRFEADFVLSVNAGSLDDFALRWTKCSTDIVRTAEYMDAMLPVRTMNH
jgi:hypothetical protein